MSNEMKWKVWFEDDECSFALEFEGNYNFVTDSAKRLAKLWGVEFNYRLDELEDLS